MSSQDLDEAYNTLNLSLKDRSSYDRYFIFTENSAANELAQRILIDRSTSKNILTGIKGCGKTTELFRLLRDVEDQYFGVYCTMRSEAYVRKVSANDILLSILLDLFTSCVKKGLRLDDKLVKALAAWLNDTLSASRVDFEGKRLDDKALCSKVKKVKGTLMAQKVRDNVQSSLEERKGDLVEWIDKLVTIIEATSKKKVLVVVDDLDKMPLDRATMIFTEQGDLLTNPGCKIIYTAPYSMVHTQEFRKVSRSFRKYVNQGPIMVIGRQGKQGLDTMRDVVSKRMGLNLIEGKALDTIMAKTGGVVSDLLRCLSEACINARTEGKEIIDPAIVDSVLDDIRKDGTRTLGAADCQVLREVQKGKITDFSPTFLKLLDDGYILEYVGEEGKYHVHPLVVPVLKEKGPL